METVVVAKMRIEKDACWLFTFITNRSGKREEEKNNREKSHRCSNHCVHGICVNLLKIIYSISERAMLEGTSRQTGRQADRKRSLLCSC